MFHLIHRLNLSKRNPNNQSPAPHFPTTKPPLIQKFSDASHRMA